MSNKRKIAIYIVLLLIVSYMMPVEKNWTESYSQKHNWPYGADVTRDIWTDLFPESEIMDADLPIWNTLRDNDFESKQMYVLFDKSLSFDSLDRSSLLNFVNEGNSALLVSDRIDGNLLDTLKITKDYNTNEYTSFVNGLQVSTKDQDFFDSRDSNYTFTIRNYDKFFTDIDTVDNEMIGLAYGSDSLELTYVKIPFGEGHFYLHNQPLLLTNYYVLSDEGKRYLERMTSYLPSYDIIWDNNYKMINEFEKKSPLNVVLSHSTLKWAYWISLLGLLLLFVFRIKRRQRIIPVVEPPANDSLDFTKTMGNLYFNTAGNKVLAQKKILVLKEYLSRKLYLSDIRFSEDEVMVIVNKTSQSKEEVQKLFKIIQAISTTEKVSDGQLKVFNRMVNRMIRDN